jgi:hypothetical protein
MMWPLMPWMETFGKGKDMINTAFKKMSRKIQLSAGSIEKSDRKNEWNADVAY